MGKHNKTKWERYYLIGLLIIFIIGAIHTGFSAHSLYNCNGCSAPYTLAFIFPGGLYLIILGFLAIIYFLIRRKYFFALCLFLGILGFLAIIALKLYGLL